MAKSINTFVLKLEDGDFKKQLQNAQKISQENTERIEKNFASFKKSTDLVNKEKDSLELLQTSLKNITREYAKLSKQQASQQTAVDKTTASITVYQAQLEKIKLLEDSKSKTTKIGNIEFNIEKLKATLALQKNILESTKNKLVVDQQEIEKAKEKIALQKISAETILKAEKGTINLTNSLKEENDNIARAIPILNSRIAKERELNKLYGERRVAIAPSSTTSSAQPLSSFGTSEKDSIEKNRIATEKLANSKEQLRVETEKAKATEVGWYRRTYINTKATNSYEDAIKRLTLARDAGAIDQKKYTTALGVEKTKLKEAELSAKKHHGTIESGTNSIVRHWRQLETLALMLYTVKTAWDNTLGSGIATARMMESNTFGIAALTSANTRMTDSLNNTLTPLQKFQMGVSIAEDTMKQLRIESLKTPATFKELTDVYQQAIGQTLGMGSAFGSTVKEIGKNTIELSKSFTNIAGAIGQPMDRVKEEIRSALTGNVSTDSIISTMLFGNPTQANAAIRKAMDIPNGVADLYKKMLEPFKILEDQRSFDKGLNQMKGAWEIAMVEMVSKSGMFQDITDAFYDMAQEITSDTDGIVESFDGFYYKAKEIADVLSNFIVPVTAIASFTLMVSAVNLLTKSTKALTIAAMANPYIAGAAIIGTGAYTIANYLEDEAKRLDDVSGIVDNSVENIYKQSIETIKKNRKLLNQEIGNQSKKVGIFQQDVDNDAFGESLFEGENYQEVDEKALKAEKEKLALMQKRYEYSGLILRAKLNEKNTALEIVDSAEQQAELLTKLNFNEKLHKELVSFSNKQEEKRVTLTKQLLNIQNELSLNNKKLIQDENKNLSAQTEIKKEINFLTESEQEFKNAIAEIDKKTAYDKAVAIQTTTKLQLEAQSKYAIAMGDELKVEEIKHQLLSNQVASTYELWQMSIKNGLTKDEQLKSEIKYSNSLIALNKEDLATEETKEALKEKARIASLKEFHAFDEWFDGEDDKKVEEKFKDWGETLNSSISNSIVDALQGGDIKSAFEALGASIGSSMLQSGTQSLLGGSGGIFNSLIGKQATAATASSGLTGLLGGGAVASGFATAGVGFAVSAAVPALVSAFGGKKKIDQNAENLKMIQKQGEERNVILKKQSETYSALDLSGSENAKAYEIAYKDALDTIRTSLNDNEVYYVNSNNQYGGQLTSSSYFDNANLSTIINDLLTAQVGNASSYSYNPNAEYEGTVQNTYGGTSKIAFEDVNQAKEQLAKIPNLILDIGNVMLTTISDMKSQVVSWQDLYENTFNSSEFSTQRLQDAKTSLEDIGITDFETFLHDISSIALPTSDDTDAIVKMMEGSANLADNWQRELSLEEIKKKLSDIGTTEALDSVSKLQGVIGNTGISSELTFQELQNLNPEIALFAEALAASNTNIKTLEDSLKTQEQLVQDMANNLGISINSTFDDLKGGLGGLTDSELEFLQANKALQDSFGNSVAIINDNINKESQLSQIYQLTHTDRENELKQREDALALMGEEDKARQISINGLIDAVAIQTENNSLTEEYNLLKMSGDEVATLAYSRSLELDSIDDTNKALQESIWALEDLAKATTEFDSLAEALFQATATEEEKRQAVYSNLLSNENVELQKKIYMAEDLANFDAMRLQAIYDNAKYAEEAEKARLEAIKDNTTATLESQKTIAQSEQDALQETLDATLANISTAESLISSLSSTVNELRGVALEGTSYSIDTFYNDIDEALKYAATPFTESYQDAVDAAIKSSSALMDAANFTTSRDMKFAQIQAASEFDSMDITLETQLDYLKQIEVNTSGLIDGLEVAINGLSESITGIANTPVAAPTTSLTDLYREVEYAGADLLSFKQSTYGQGMAAENYGDYLKYQLPMVQSLENASKDYIAAGGSELALSGLGDPLHDTVGETSNEVALVNYRISLFDQYGFTGTAAAALAAYPHSFAVGTTNVPYDMYANIHRGEIIVPQTFSEGIRNGDVMLGGDNEVFKDILQEMRNLKKEVEGLKASSNNNSERQLQVQKATFSETAKVYEAVSA